MAKILWVSRHDLSPAQVAAIRELHGADAEIVKDPVSFTDFEGLKEYIFDNPEAFVYVVAGAPHYLDAALSGFQFGFFENHPGRRADGVFGLKAVYHVVTFDDGRPGVLVQVWENHDPESDEGEVLEPVRR